MIAPPGSVAVVPQREANAHHAVSPHEVVLLLETDPHAGLSGQEARSRLERIGPNALPAARGARWPQRVLRQLHHPLIYVLLAAAAITAWLGAYVDSLVILAVVVANALVGFVQESRAEAALDALRSLVRTQARVVRDGREQQVPSEELVPGDVVLVQAGDRIPADVRLIRLAELSVDESALTGESVPVAKDEAVLLPPATQVADRRNMLYSGTLVTCGAGAGVAVATGPDTELGHIHRLVGTAQDLATPLTRKLTWFSKVLTVAILGLAAVTFAIGLARGQEPVQTFTAAVALAVGAIPEGLPAAVTITLAIGVARMARRRAVIRRLPAVETLGSTTVICSDKTGTLTRNQMTVCAIWTPDAGYEVTGTGYAPDGVIQPRDGTAAATLSSHALRWCLLAGAGCNDTTLSHDGNQWSVIGDPTEAAMVVAAEKAGLTRLRIESAYPRVGTIAFSSERRYMATLHLCPATGEHVVLVKGAAERLLELCQRQMAADGRLRPLNHSAVVRAAEHYARAGLRVLATAMHPAAAPDTFTTTHPGSGMVFTGLQAMLDPPRPAARAAVRACHRAGIVVKMITGDHAGTATAIATQIELVDGGGTTGRVLTGSELAALPADRYPDAVDRARVFARVSPEQKLHLVHALQQRGHIVAMTGDGVNDAPALRQANIGVAMGLAGTEVAKEAADMVLTDDDFATIEAAVEEGRGVFDNLTKFIAWTLPTNIGEGLVILAAITFGATLPILPTQILWINMTTAVLLGLMLAFEPKEAAIMNRPPRRPDQPLLTRALLERILLVSTLLVAGAWWLFIWESTHGATTAEARTAALNLFVAVEAFYLFSCRSLQYSPWRIGIFTNRWLIAGLTAQAAAQLALTYLPAMHTVFHTAPIGADVWLRILVIAAIASAIVGLDKHLRAKARRPR